MRGLFMRITPYNNDDATLQRIAEIIELTTVPARYVISEEIASHLHYHILTYSDRSPERIRYAIKSKIECQLYISGREVQDKVKAIAYTIKDGKYIQKNMDVNDFLLAKQISRPKRTFDDGLKELKEIYKTNMDDEELLRGLIRVYKEFNKKINRLHLKNHLESIRIYSSQDAEDQLVRSILEFL